MPEGLGQVADVEGDHLRGGGVIVVDAIEMFYRFTV